MGEILNGFDAKTKEKLIKEVQSSTTLNQLPDPVRKGIIKEVLAENGNKIKHVEKASDEETEKLLDAIMPAGFRKQDRKEDIHDKSKSAEAQRRLHSMLHPSQK